MRAGRLLVKNWKPMIATIGVYAIWGFSFLAAKIGQQASSPFIILMYRFDIALAIMALIGLLKRPRIRLKGRNIKGLLSLGLCEPVIYFIGEQYGMKHTNSAFTGVMIAVIPIVTLWMTAVFLKERPTRPQWQYSFLSIAGVAAITVMAGGDGQIKPVGVMLLSVAVIAGSAYSVISRGISDQFTAFERSFIMQLMGAVFFTGMALTENRGDLTRLFAPLANGQFVFAALYLGLGASVAGYLLFNYAVATMPMPSLMAMGNLTVVLSVLAGVVFLNEPFSPGAFGALVGIIVGIWGVQKSSPLGHASENPKGLIQEAAQEIPPSGH